MGQGSVVKTRNLSLDCESVRWAPKWKAEMLLSSRCLLLECFGDNNGDKPGMCPGEQARQRSAGELGEEGLLCEGRGRALWTQGAARYTPTVFSRAVCSPSSRWWLWVGHGWRGAQLGLQILTSCVCLLRGSVRASADATGLPRTDFR